MSNDANQTALRMAVQLLRGLAAEGQLYTQEQIRGAVATSMAAVTAFGTHSATDMDERWVVEQVERECNVWVPASGVLEDPTGHEEWLETRKPEIAWDFWERYSSYLLEVKGFGLHAVNRIDEVTDDVLRRLEDPRRSGEWDRRGLVVGQVQSGKTAHYTGLICKAADAGYRLIVVMAGVHNNLRSQTQLRLDEGFYGFDSRERRLYDENSQRMGVGLHSHRRLPVISLTTSDEKGDFALPFAKRSQGALGGNLPVLLVIKKHASILKNVHKWATEIWQQTDPSSGRRRVHGVPMLVIDDEADNASINTKKVFDDDGNVLDPTKINQAIRKLLRDFEQVAYVGYTATPFANIYVGQETHEQFGDDVFPRSFIVGLKPPEDYFGPARVFGLLEDRAVGISETIGLPVRRAIDDYSEWIPDGHKNGFVPMIEAFPSSLRRALQSFVLTAAIREARGEHAVHNSMLVHVTRYTSVQDAVGEQVEDVVRYLEQRLKRGDGQSRPSIFDELKGLYESDYVPTTLMGFPDTTMQPWGEIVPHLFPAAAKIRVLKINGTARDALEYEDHRKVGLSVVAIGGDKLSRGLTLEGLSISYYLRATKMYDTLLQMGRWFGYRPGYGDLCRLFTTKILMEWYRRVAAADEELRMEFDHMVAQHASPEKYGLRVRHDPDGLLVTAPSKMRAGLRLQLSFSGKNPQTISFAPSRVASNLAAAERLIRKLDVSAAKDASGGRVKWTGADADDVQTFLLGYDMSNDEVVQDKAQLLHTYIKNRMAEGELIDWTVALIANGRGREENVNGYRVRLTQRDGSASTDSVWRTGTLLSPSDELLDLDAGKREEALSLTIEAWKRDAGATWKRKTEPTVSTGYFARQVRSKESGLLLLYPLDLQMEGRSLSDLPIIAVGFCFPVSGGADDGAVEYIVNKVYLQQELGFDA